MTTAAECLATLLRLIDRAEGDELAEAQAAIIAYALAAPDLERRTEAMASLQTGLADAFGAEHRPPLQTAYYSVVDAMIDRTRDAVLAPRASGN